MKRLYSTAATLLLAGALVLPTATTAQAADSDLTVSVTLSVYNKGSVGHALEVYDRTKQIDEGKCKSFSNGNNDYRIEFAQGDNFTRCSIFPPFEGPENAGKYYSLDDKGEFIFVYSSEQLMQETEFLGRPRDIGYISIRPLVFDLDSASAGAKFTDFWADQRGDSKYSPTGQIVLWNKPDGKVAVHGKKTGAYQGNATVAAQYGTPVPSFEPLTPAPTDPAAPDRNRTAAAAKSGSLIGSISSTTWIIVAAVAGGLVVLAGIVIFVLRGRSRKADSTAKSQRQQAREEARAAKRQAREDRKRAKAGATASAPMSQGALPLGGSTQAAPAPTAPGATPGTAASMPIATPVRGVRAPSGASSTPNSAASTPVQPQVPQAQRAQASAPHTPLQPAQQAYKPAHAPASSQEHTPEPSQTEAGVPSFAAAQIPAQAEARHASTEPEQPVAAVAPATVPNDEPAPVVESALPEMSEPEEAAQEPKTEAFAAAQTEDARALELFELAFLVWLDWLKRHGVVKLRHRMLIELTIAQMQFAGEGHHMHPALRPGRLVVLLSVAEPSDHHSFVVGRILSR